MSSFIQRSERKLASPQRSAFESPSKIRGGSITNSLFSQFSDFRQDIKKKYDFNNSPQRRLQTSVRDPQPVQKSLIGFSPQSTRGLGQLQKDLKEMASDRSQRLDTIFSPGRKLESSRFTPSDIYQNKRSEVPQQRSAAIIDKSSLRVNTTWNNARSGKGFLSDIFKSNTGRRGFTANSAQSSRIQFSPRLEDAYSQAQPSFISSPKRKHVMQKIKSISPRKQRNNINNQIRSEVSHSQSINNINSLLEQQRQRTKENSQSQNFSRNDFKSRNIDSMIPLFKIQEIQDILVDAGDDNFGNLSSRYTDELVKLASVINYRVKSNTYRSSLKL